jgi:PAS domain S-box-containing protein
LEQNAYDLILADYPLPACGSLRALQVARQKRPDLPFLLILGAVGEDAAIESLRRGAADFVLRTRLQRLVPAMRRAVQQARERLGPREAEAQFMRREPYLRALLANSPDVISVLNQRGLLEYVSPSVTALLGYEPEALLGRNAFSLVHPQDVAAAQRALHQVLNDPALKTRLELRCRKPDGAWCAVEVLGQNRLQDPVLAGVVFSSRDVGERRSVENERPERRQRLQLAAQASDGRIGGWSAYLIRLLSFRVC